MKRQNLLDLARKESGRDIDVLAKSFGPLPDDSTDALPPTFKP
jgi:hypothetical protein